MDDLRLSLNERIRARKDYEQARAQEHEKQTHNKNERMQA